jgi:hypothetical protein
MCEMSSQVDYAPLSGTLTIYSLAYKFGLECVLYITLRQAEEYMDYLCKGCWYNLLVATYKERGFNMA